LNGKVIPLISHCLDDTRRIGVAHKIVRGGREAYVGY
jgi:hypothetical protein